MSDPVVSHSILPLCRDMFEFLKVVLMSLLLVATACCVGETPQARMNTVETNVMARVSLDHANNVNVLTDSNIMDPPNGTQASEALSPEVQSALIALAGVLVSVLVSLILAVISYWASCQVYVKNQVFDIKKEALLSALDVMDDYLSWLDYSDSTGNLSPSPMRRNITPLELTTRARESYNKLCVTCDNSELLSSFLEIIFGEKINVCEEYNKFRAAARTELGLSKFEFDSNRIFLSVVSTSNLSSKKK